MVTAGLALSPISELLIEESVIGWKEFELEVMRDGADNVVIICSIENVDAMGVHTGDSITVAPIQTLTDKEYQLMRDSAIQIIREIGVDTGGPTSNLLLIREKGKQVVIEMNPRVSRSSALASKAHRISDRQNRCENSLSAIIWMKFRTTSPLRPLPALNRRLITSLLKFRAGRLKSSRVLMKHSQHR